MAVIRRELSDIRSSPRPLVDRARLRATTDAEIAAQIAGDADTAPDVSDWPIQPEPRAVRAAVGMTQEAFAEAIGVPLGTLRNWEQGRTPPEPAARTLYWLLSKDADALLKVLKSRRISEATKPPRVSGGDRRR